MSVREVVVGSLGANVAQRRRLSFSCLAYLRMRSKGSANSHVAQRFSQTGLLIYPTKQQVERMCYSAGTELKMLSCTMRIYDLSSE